MVDTNLHIQRNIALKPITIRTENIFFQFKKYHMKYNSPNICQLPLSITLSAVYSESPGCSSDIDFSGKGIQ